MTVKYEKFAALVRARENGTAINYFANSNPKCPHCGEVYDIHENEAFHLYDPDKDYAKIECDHCEMGFIVEVHREITFNTEDSDELEDGDVPL